MKTIGLMMVMAVAALAGSADGDSYGLQKGSFGANFGGGMQINAGAHPMVTGGIDIGLAKYVGLYAEGTGVLAYKGNVGEFFGGGGLMVTANNRSRIVPFARIGADYGRLQLFGWGGANVPLLKASGGFDAYITRHFGIETQVGMMHSLGRVGGHNLGAVTFGVFYRSK